MMNKQISKKSGRECKNDGKVRGRGKGRRYVAYVYTKPVENGIQVVSASLWAGQQDFCSLEGMSGEVYANKEEIRDAVEELAETKNVSIDFLPVIDFN
jgi:hypothetical protein